ncbi:MAG: cytochrome c oxidase assembly protein [Hyphomicrobiaceae bacterium]
MADPKSKAAGGARGNMRVAAICTGIAFSMVGMAYAAVPLYRMFCQVTGFGGTTQRAIAASSHTIERFVNVRFDVNMGPGLPWVVIPTTRVLRLKLGENAVAIYRATNTSDKTTIGTSSFNVTPDQAGAFFNKIECFCFTEQTLGPGQSADLPVSFFVDPAMARDADGALINDITLSYTFYPVDPAKSRNAAQKVKDVRKGT